MIKLLKSLTRKQLLLYTILSAGFGLNFLLLFTTCEAISPVFTTKATLALLTLMTAVVFCLSQQSSAMEKYRGKGSCLFLGLLSVYSSLATFGQRFFLNGNTRIHFSGEGVFYCVLGAIWYLPILWSFLWVLEFFSANKAKREANPSRRRKCFFALFGILLAVQAVILVIFWPGFFPEDAMNQLRPALGLAPLNDWHPVINSLIQRLILTVVPQAGAIVAVQMVLFVWLLAAFLMIGWDYGMKLPWLALFGGIFLLLPNQALSFANAMKDYAFTLALLWGTYLLLQLVLKKPWTKKLSFYFCFALDLFLTASLRHNGMVPLAAVAALCFLLGLKKGNGLWKKAVAACVAAVAALMVFKGPVYNLLDVIPNTQSPFTSMLCAVGSYINKDLPLSEEAQEIMETVIPMEDWRDYYRRYEGHDTYYWGRPNDAMEYDTSEITAGKAFRVYLEALFKAPDVVLKDRLDGMDILWDVVMPDDSFNGNGFHYIYPMGDEDVLIDMDGMAEGQEANKFCKQTSPAQAYFATTNWPHHGLANVLIWRTGIYLIAFLALILFWWKNGLKTLWYAAMPMLGNIAASILILYHQSFRYVYFVQLGVLAMVFVTIALRNEMAKRS